jgi:hypothetical protein
MTDEMGAKLDGEVAELCGQISAEQDTGKFLDLVARLNALLEHGETNARNTRSA